MLSPEDTVQADIVLVPEYDLQLQQTSHFHTQTTTFICQDVELYKLLQINRTSTCTRIKMLSKN